MSPLTADPSLEAVIDTSKVSTEITVANIDLATKSGQPTSKWDIPRTERDDPFQFGQRYLDDEDAVWDYNAWDHVEWDEEQEILAQEKLQKQRENPVNDFDRKLYMSNPSRYWDLFYRNNRSNFFKDRKWLQLEFPSIYAKATAADSGPKTILEVGCGAGNTLFPIFAANKNPELKIVGVDFSHRAVELVRESPEFDPAYIATDVWDLADDSGILPAGLEENSVDFIILIFVFSALAPEQWAVAIRNVDRLLKPGGEVLFRDYGRYDMAQLRFKGGRLLQDSFYVRGDGTRVYFFTEDELREIFGTKFATEKMGTDRRLLVNRKRKLKMYRIWLQARFIKHAASDDVKRLTR
ncbi:S-adenosyl-L-methionine-dependent methyltransferase [Lipomyces tetrasporus]|uniref:tRNA N(3)-methylcytidine methyltransferase n=1 Tax=Lipomyces tetrasporus TaxID=54092 RepID=A0AAD7VWB6_9ASCO|nr:S-adenosyl-L-methionine-dependent methyltransferase [Lipomyces tetrasporus]KAJ8103270.1 S-adenosyl-L-methionine-dependent methyltransferase [Lipomyces tetrasporus]